MTTPDDPLTDGQYTALLDLRTSLRRFLHWSEEQAAAAGLTAQQHQLLLAIRGQRDGEAPTIGVLAEHLLLRHHSVVELVDRAQLAGLVTRSVDALDRRVVRVTLTPAGRLVLAQLSAAHLEEIARLAPTVARLTDHLSERSAAPRSTERPVRPRDQA